MLSDTSQFGLRASTQAGRQAGNRTSTDHSFFARKRCSKRNETRQSEIHCYFSLAHFTLSPSSSISISPGKSTRNREQNDSIRLALHNLTLPFTIDSIRDWAKKRVEKNNNNNNVPKQATNTLLP